MSIGLDVKLQVSGLKELQRKIDYIKKISTIRTDSKFQKFIQDKFLETVNKISRENLFSGELTEEYISNNKIRTFSEGFVLYNDTVVETDTEGYGGVFSIALAFEYGTGLVGQENPKVGAWEYNVNQHENGWYYFKDGTFNFTRGMQGFEIYRLTQEEIKKQLPKWVDEYGNRTGGASQ